MPLCEHEKSGNMLWNPTKSAVPKYILQVPHTIEHISIYYACIKNNKSVMTNIS